MNEGYVYGGMQVKSLSWWDRLAKRRCTFCKRRLKNKMLVGPVMTRPNFEWHAAGFGSMYVCVDVDECQKFVARYEKEAEESEKKKLAQAIEEARKVKTSADPVAAKNGNDKEQAK